MSVRVRRWAEQTIRLAGRGDARRVCRLRGREKRLVLAVVVRRHCAGAAARARTGEHERRNCPRQRQLRRANGDGRPPARRAAAAASCGAPTQRLGAGAGPCRRCFVGLGVGGGGRGRVIVHLALVFGPRLVTGDGNARERTRVWAGDGEPRA